MNTTAIRQAIKLYQQPVELAGIMAVNASLPTGMTDLLRLTASEKLLQDFCDERDIDAEMLYNILTHYIEKVLFKEGNTPFKILGLDNHLSHGVIQHEKNTNELARLHHQLLMKIYHPDKNRSTSSVFYTSKISKAYDAVKQLNSQQSELSELAQKPHHYEKPPHSFYHATRNAQLQINRTRNTLFGIGVVTMTLLTAALLLINQPDSSGLIVRNQVSKPLITPIAEAPPADIVISNVLHKNQSSNDTNQPGLISTAASTTSAVQTSGQVSASKMQPLLHDLETAYEKGNVGKIMPILANTPEMSQQSDAALNAKLETLFNMTRQRKMVLYDFTWENLAGNIQGEGKFLSRFLLSGQNEWQTRTGIATIKAIIDNNKVKITQLEMNDQLEKNTNQQ